jgi:hypothetical protein
MGLLDRLSEKKKIQVGLAPEIVAADAAAAAPEPVKEPSPVAAAQGAVPWANGACRACAGLGFNSQGVPCRICDLVAVKQKRPTSDAFLVQSLGDGTCYWESKADAKTNGQSPMLANAGKAVKQEVKTEIPEATGKQPEVQHIATETMVPSVQKISVSLPAPAPAPVVPATTTVPMDKRFRSKKGFTLVLNAAVTKGENKVTRLIDVFHEMQSDFNTAQAAQGGKTYYDYDPFKRRDEFAKVAEKLCEQFGTDFVVADAVGGTPDFKALVEAIRPYASMEIVGTV